MAPSRPITLLRLQTSGASFGALISGFLVVGSCCGVLARREWISGGVLELHVFPRGAVGSSWLATPAILGSAFHSAADCRISSLGFLRLGLHGHVFLNCFYGLGREFVRLIRTSDRVSSKRFVFASIHFHFSKSGSWCLATEVTLTHPSNTHLPFKTGAQIAWSTEQLSPGSRL